MLVSNALSKYYAYVFGIELNLSLDQKFPSPYNVYVLVLYLFQNKLLFECIIFAVIFYARLSFSRSVSNARDFSLSSPPPIHIFRLYVIHCHKCNIFPERQMMWLNNVWSVLRCTETHKPPASDITRLSIALLKAITTTLKYRHTNNKHHIQIPIQIHHFFFRKEEGLTIFTRKNLQTINVNRIPE